MFKKQNFVRTIRKKYSPTSNGNQHMMMIPTCWPRSDRIGFKGRVGRV